jgi:chromosomal replication initiation ATPase DnaA
MKAVRNEAVRAQCAVYGPKIEIIQKVVCDYFGIEVSRSQEHTRYGESIRARRRIHFLCREFIPRCPLHVIGLLTGNGIAFDHATISHSHHAILRELNFKNKQGERVYPEIHIEITKLRSLVNKAFKEAGFETKQGAICPHCGNEIE